MDNRKLILPSDPFEGTFAELLKLVRQYPALVESSKSRFMRLAIRLGVNEERSAAIQRIYGTESLTSYRAFKDFYGVEPSVQSVMNDFFGAALEGHGADKKALTLIGPPGAGKSDIVLALKKIYRTSEPIPYNDRCPVHDNPMGLLFMVPLMARQTAKGKSEQTRVEAAKLIESLGLLEEGFVNFASGEGAEILRKNGAKATAEGLAELAVANPDDFVSVIVYGLGLPKATRNSIGKPCPYCRERLFGEFTKDQPEDHKVELAQFPIKSMFFDMDDEGNFGIVDVPEVQPLNFDISTWIGTRNIGKIGRIDSRDPRSVELNGAFDRANRGVIVLTEGLKNPPEAHRVLLEALQGRRVGIPQPLGGSLHWEGVVIIHSNEGEYTKFLADPVNEPYWDRFLRILFKYPLEASEAAKISRKLYSLSDFSKPVSEGGCHVEPLLFDYEARLRVLSYLEEDPNGTPMMTKLDAYDGKQVRSRGMGTLIDVADLRGRAGVREGMEGFSPRKTAEEVIGALAAQAKQLFSMGKVNGACVTTRAFRDKMFEVLKSEVKDPKKRKLYERFLTDELEEYRRKELSKLVRSAFMESFGKECQDTFDKYVDWSNASVLGTTPKSSGFGRVSRIEMEDFLRQVESDPNWGITSGQTDRFRREVQAAVTEYMKENPGKKVPFTVHQGLKECIERNVLKAVKDVVRILTESTAKTGDEAKKLEGAKSRLINEHGFCPHCAESLLVEVQQTRGFIKE